MDAAEPEQGLRAEQTPTVRYGVHPVEKAGCPGDQTAFQVSLQEHREDARRAPCQGRAVCADRVIEWEKHAGACLAGLLQQPAMVF